MKRIVTIGGGTGSSVLLRGLREHAAGIDVAAVVTTFDDGGSSGRLRREFGVPALGDLRRCVAALAASDAVAETFELRFGDASGALAGDAFGNLLLLAAWQRCGSLTEAVAEVGRAVDARGRVLPVSDAPSTLCARYSDGAVARGESAIDRGGVSESAIAEVYLDPPAAATDAALAAVRAADVIVLGPGDLYTSVVPNLLAGGMADALRGSRGRIVLVCNLRTKRGETDGFTASDFVRVVDGYLRVGGPRVDALVVHRSDGDVDGGFVAVDDVGLSRFDGLEVLAGDFVGDGDGSMHDGRALAGAVGDLHGWRG